MLKLGMNQGVFEVKTGIILNFRVRCYFLSNFLNTTQHITANTRRNDQFETGDLVAWYI